MRCDGAVGDFSITGYRLTFRQQMADFTRRKNPPFNLRPGQEIIDVESFPEVFNSEGWEIPIKQESEDPQTATQVGAERKSSISPNTAEQPGSLSPDGKQTPPVHTVGPETVPNAPAKSADGLGKSILGAPQPTLGGVLSKADQEALLRAQREMFAKLAESQVPPSQKDLTDAMDISEPGENVFELQARYDAAHSEYRKKKARDQLTLQDEIDFSRLQHEYNAEKTKLNELCEQAAMDDEESEADQENAHLFVSQKNASTKSSKRKRSFRPTHSDDEDSEERLPRKQARSKKKTNIRSAKTRRRNQNGKKNNRPGHLSLAQPNIFEDAEAAEAMGDQPEFAAGNKRRDALNTLRGNAPARSAVAIDVSRINRAIKNFVNRESIKPGPNGHWSLKGLRTTLKNHQVINAGFMRGRERGTEEPRGGIIADQMGLGKTLTCLANMVNGRPRKGDADAIFTTLVVVPRALLSQWKSEIARHCEFERTRTRWGLGRVRIFRDNMSKGYDLDDFRTADIVLTTYYDVMKSWPEAIYPEGLPQSDRAQYFKDHLHGKRGPLHRFRFLRIVLDEGHIIRNPESRTSQGCIHLTGDFRWVLTGTPMINGAFDLYALQCFIGHPLVQKMTLDSFKFQFCNNKDLMSWDMLSDDLLKTMARFTHKDSLLGCRLVKLPKPHNTGLALRFTPLERGIYDIVHKRFKARARTFALDGSTQTANMNILALITLLRQMTAHPLMLQAKVCDYLEPEDFDQLGRVINKQAKSGDSGETLIHTLRSLIRSRRSRPQTGRPYRSEMPDVNPHLDQEEFDEGSDVEELQQPMVNKKTSRKRGTGGAHGKNTDFGRVLTSLKQSKNPHVMGSRMLCSTCNRPARMPRVTACNHYYCATHLEDLFDNAAVNDQYLEVRCVKKLENDRPCDRRIEQNEAVDPADAPKWLGSSGEVIPSTKTIAFKSQVMEWLACDPKAKIVVFTQWISFLRILSRICEIEGWGYRTLHGKIKAKTREENIANFQGDPATQILICTLKTGGVGLNLTAGRFVLNTDPYWSDAIELQAFSRVYRDVTFSLWFRKDIG